MQSQKKARGKNKIKMLYRGAIIFLSAICVLFFAAGAPSSQEMAGKGPESKKEKTASQKMETNLAGPDKQLTEDYIYDPTGKTDPFRSFIAVQEAIEDKERKKPRTYLETLDISQLDLIAIIVGPKGNYAMVRDARGLGYVIKKGTPIGLHEGVVRQINEDEVIISEKYRGKHRDIAKKLSSLQ